MTGIGKSIARNTAFQFIGKIVTTGLSLIVVAVLTRKMGVSQYGIYVSILAYVNLFVTFADLGVNVYILKRISIRDEDHTRLIAQSLSLRLVTLVVMVALSLACMFVLPYDRITRIGISIALVSLAAQGVNSLFVTILQSRLEMRYAVMAEIWGRVALLVATLAAIYSGKGVLWVVAAMVLSSVVNTILSYFAARRYESIVLEWKVSAWNTILKESLPISVSAILGYLYFKIDTVLLSVLPLQGGLSNKVEVGIYGSAYKVLEILLLVPAIFLGSVFPILSDMLAKDDRKSVLSLVQRSVEIMALFGLPIALIVFMLAPQVIGFIAGSEFLDAVVPLRILSVALVVNYIAAVFTYTALTMNKQVQLIWIYGVALLFNLSSNLYYIPRYSYRAAAVTTLLTELIILFLPYIVCRKELQFRLQFGRILRLVLASLVLGVVLYLVKEWPLFPALFIAVGVFTLAVVLTRTVSRSEIRTMLSRGA